MNGQKLSPDVKDIRRSFEKLQSMIANSNLSENVVTAGPVVSIVIPCRNEKNQIKFTLESILAQEPPPGGFEVIVADGMSDDGTRDTLHGLAKDHPRLRIIDNPGLIVSTGLNAAIRAARGSIILRMDMHSRYASDYVLRCLEVLQASRADNVGGPWVAQGNGVIGRAIAAAFQSPFSFGGTRGHNPGYEGIVDTVYLGCWRRQIFDRIGMFDEQLVRNQDDEFNLRLTRAGGRIWQSPRIRSTYIPRHSLFALFRQYAQYGYWKVKVIQKHRLPASVRHLVPAAFVLSLVVLTPAYFWSPIAAKIWSLILGSYLLGVLAASFVTTAKTEWKLFPVLPLVFACYHFGYGYGFLRAIGEIVLRRHCTRDFTDLTRRSAGNVPQKSA